MTAVQVGIGVSSLFINILRIIFLAAEADYEQGAFFFFISSGLILVAIAILSFFVVKQLNLKERINSKVQEASSFLEEEKRPELSTIQRFRESFK